MERGPQKNSPLSFPRPSMTYAGERGRSMRFGGPGISSDAPTVISTIRSTDWRPRGAKHQPRAPPRRQPGRDGRGDFRRSETDLRGPPAVCSSWETPFTDYVLGAEFFSTRPSATRLWTHHNLGTFNFRARQGASSRHRDFPVRRALSLHSPFGVPMGMDAPKPPLICESA